MHQLTARKSRWWIALTQRLVLFAVSGVVWVCHRDHDSHHNRHQWPSLCRFCRSYRKSGQYTFQQQHAAASMSDAPNQCLCTTVSLRMQTTSAWLHCTRMLQCLHDAFSWHAYCLPAAHSTLPGKMTVKELFSMACQPFVTPLGLVPCFQSQRSAFY